LKFNRIKNILRKLYLHVTQTHTCVWTKAQAHGLIWVQFSDNKYRTVGFHWEIGWQKCFFLHSNVLIAQKFSTNALNAKAWSIVLYWMVQTLVSTWIILTTDSTLLPSSSTLVVERWKRKSMRTHYWSILVTSWSVKRVL